MCGALTELEEWVSRMSSNKMEIEAPFGVDSDVNTIMRSSSSYVCVWPVKVSVSSRNHFQ